MREFWKVANYKSKIALSLSIAAAIAAVVGMFALKPEMRIICWACIIVVWVLDYLVIFEDTVKLRKENYLKDYEILQLKYSYRQMGIYIDSLDIEQLKDIDLRIGNELRDIEIKKEHFKEKL